MAITLQGSPGNFAPVYNAMWWYVDSDNKAREGFRYIFDVYDSGTANYTRYDTPPRPSDGWGQLDLSSKLQARVNYDALPGIQLAVPAKSSYFLYDLKVGEEYLAAFAYTGYAQYTGSGTPYDGRVRLNGMTGHTFVVGSQIDINQTDGGTAVPLLQGLFTVVAVPSTSSVVIDMLYYNISGLPAMGGSVTYSDKRKIQTPNLYTATQQLAYNTALDLEEFNGYDFSLRQMSAATGTKKFLTSMPDGFVISPTGDAHFNLANMKTTVPFTLRIVTSDGDVFSKPLTPDNTAYIMQIPVGPNNMGAASVVSGSLPVIKPTTTGYTVQVITAVGVNVSEVRSFVLDKRCDRKDIHLLFMDRGGSLASFAFPLQALFDNDYEKVKHEPVNGGFSALAGKFQYDLTTGGTTVIGSERTQGLTLTTNWITWETANYMAELLGSPVVLVRLDGVYHAVDVVTVSQSNPHPDKKKLFNRVVQVKFSNINPINA